MTTRKAQQWPQARDQVFVVDTLGELMSFYACAQVAFVGGSLQPIGGHNLLEPAAVGTPAVTGPHLHNFSEISRRMREADAVTICEDAACVQHDLARLLGDPAQREAMARPGWRWWLTARARWHAPWYRLRRICHQWLARSLRRSELRRQRAAQVGLRPGCVGFGCRCAEARPCEARAPHVCLSVSCS